MQEFLQYQEKQQQQQQEEEEGEGHNVFMGFDEEFLAEVFNIDNETALKLQGEGDKREGGIAKVEGGLQILTPPTRKKQQRRRRQREEEEEQEQQQQQEEEEEDEDEEEEEEEQQEQRRGRRRRQSGNGLEETVCTKRLRQNLGRAKSPDIFVSQAGAIKTVNSLDLPALGLLGLSADYGLLYKVNSFITHPLLLITGLACI